MRCSPYCINFIIKIIIVNTANTLIISPRFMGKQKKKSTAKINNWHQINRETFTCLTKRKYKMYEIKMHAL